jgi:PRTRC genetic system protein E
MFQQLVPLLRQRSVLLTVASLEDDQIRVNVMPKKLKEGENSALTTPMSFTGTADELDAQLPDAIVSFVASHLELKNTLARAKEEMDAAAKAAQEETRNKANNKKPAIGPAKTAEPVAKEEPKKEPEPPRLPGLFDTAADTTPLPATSVASPPTAASPTTLPDKDEDEEADILAEIADSDHHDDTSDEEADGAA